jgi:hypothetical protein
VTMHGPDDECASCYECPGCGGADGSDPKRAHLEFLATGAVLLVCDDCNGDGVLCPFYDPNMKSDSPNDEGAE